MSLPPPSFPAVRLREGYDMAEVDAFIDRITAALDGRGPALTPDDVLNQTFTPVRLREGYDMGSVDHWLDQAVTALEEQRSRWLRDQVRHEQASAGSPGPAVPESSTVPEGREATSHPRPLSGVDPVISEQRSTPLWVWTLVMIVLGALVLALALL